MNEDELKQLRLSKPMSDLVEMINDGWSLKKTSTADASFWLFKSGVTGCDVRSQTVWALMDRGVLKQNDPAQFGEDYELTELGKRVSPLMRDRREEGRS